MISLADSFNIEVHNTRQQWIYGFVLFERGSDQKPVVPDNILLTGPAKDRLYFYTYKKFMDHISAFPEKFEAIIIQVKAGARIFSDQCIEYHEKDLQPQKVYSVPGPCGQYIFNITGTLSVDSRLVFDIAAWTIFNISFSKKKLL